MTLSYNEKYALHKLLLIASAPHRMIAMEFEPTGPEFKAAMKAVDQLARELKTEAGEGAQPPAGL